MSISQEETLARYIIEKSYYRPSDNTVRWNAFMPARDGNCSVFRISDLDQSTIWSLGEEYVASKRAKPLLGRADLAAKSAFDEGLKVIPDPVIHSKHANITSYPNEKSETKLIAMKLSQKATLVYMEA